MALILIVVLSLILAFAPMGRTFKVVCALALVVVAISLLVGVVSSDLPW
jgi:hypothetical protein